MALNPFFLNGTKSEQSLVQDLINEQLKMYGVEVFYMPRSYVTKTTIIKEVIQSEFTNAYPIEAYIDNYEGFGGQGTILSKFGIEGRDDLTLIISKERYETYISPLMEDLPNIELSTRPKEGDLIYFPLGDRLFEIKFVEHESPFYQLQKNYVYELRCELFRYEDEVIDTDIDTIDDEIEQLGYIQTLTLVSAASTAVGITSYCPAGAVNHVRMTDMGGSYSMQPIISFSASPSGKTAVGVASITTEFINCNGIYGGKIKAINLVNTGCGYTVAPWITIHSHPKDNGVGAAATVGITTLGALRSVEVTSGGGGYHEAPNISFNTPSGGQAATGISTISSAGIVTAIYVTNSGFGYTTAPTMTIADPVGLGGTIGIGTYKFNEKVVGSSSGTIARVKKWTNSTSSLEISIVDGVFTPGENIYGIESGAIYSLRIQNTDDTTSGFADNDTIETEADSIIDFTQDNPFGMP